MAVLKLTKKLATQLLKENFPVPVKDLKLDESVGGYIDGHRRYFTMVGGVEVSVEDDYSDHYGNYAIVICAGLVAQKMWLLINGVSLKRDTRAEDWFYRDKESIKRHEMREEIIQQEEERKAAEKTRFLEAKKRWECVYTPEV